MKNIKKNQLKKVIVKSLEQFENDLNKLFKLELEGGPDRYCGRFHVEIEDFELCIYQYRKKDDEYCPYSASEITDWLAALYGVSKVTSVHYDDISFDPVGIWICYEE